MHAKISLDKTGQLEERANIFLLEKRDRVRDIVMDEMKSTLVEYFPSIMKAINIYLLSIQGEKGGSSTTLQIGCEKLSHNLALQEKKDKLCGKNDSFKDDNNALKRLHLFDAQLRIFSEDFESLKISDRSFSTINWNSSDLRLVWKTFSRVSAMNLPSLSTHNIASQRTKTVGQIGEKKLLLKKKHKRDSSDPEDWDDDNSSSSSESFQ